MSRFPIGGPREPVYNFLRYNGWIMSDWSDKHWTRADGLRLHVYGSGSMARIHDKDGNQVADSDLADAVAKAQSALARLSK